MSEFDIDDYEKVSAIDEQDGCDGCVAVKDWKLCCKIMEAGICYDDDGKIVIFKLKDKSKGESDD